MSDCLYGIRGICSRYLYHERVQSPPKKAFDALSFSAYPLKPLVTTTISRPLPLWTKVTHAFTCWRCSLFGAYAEMKNKPSLTQLSFLMTMDPERMTMHKWFLTGIKSKRAASSLTFKNIPTLRRLISWAFLSPKLCMVYSDVVLDFISWMTSLDSWIWAALSQEIATSNGSTVRTKHACWPAFISTHTEEAGIHRLTRFARCEIGDWNLLTILSSNEQLQLPGMLSVGTLWVVRVAGERHAE